MKCVHVAFYASLGAMGLLTACGGGVGGGLGVGDLTTDPQALLAAEVGGNATSGLEVALGGAGLLTRVPLGELPESAVASATSALNDLLSSCLTATPITDNGTGLTLEFATGGCEVPLTNIKFEGSFAFVTDAEEETSAWSLAFNQFFVAGVGADGAAAVEIVSGESLNYEVDALTVFKASEALAAIDGLGALQVPSDHTTVTFDGNGALTYNDSTYSIVIDDLYRSFKTDCYPERGTITVGLTDEEGTMTTAQISFDDSEFGLDSDDSGVVLVSIAGVEHQAELPSRLCSGF